MKITSWKPYNDTLLSEEKVHLSIRPLGGFFNMTASDQRWGDYLDRFYDDVHRISRRSAPT